MPIASIRRHVHGSDLECLEHRRLLSSIISVSPGYQDATSAIQNALNNAGGGGTVNLAPGSYNISSQLTIPSGVILEGAGKATLNWTGSGMGNLLYSPWNSVGTKVDGVTLNGAGYKIDPDGSNLTISNNTFENISFSDSYFGNGLYIPDVETNSSITGNTFTNITGNVGIYIFNAINTQIANNTFSNDGEAIKGQWSNSGSNDSISNNTLTGIYRFGIECQGDPVNLTVSGNTLGNWQQRDSHIALSIATGEGNGINITNNVILGTGISNPSTAYTAIEAMGNNLTISGNFASGWGWAELVGFTDHWVTENNTWGVNTAVWVIEAGGVNPSVNSGNTLVPLNTQPSGNITHAPTVAAPSAPATTVTATTTAPAAPSAPKTSTATATTTAPTTTVAPTASVTPPAAPTTTTTTSSPAASPPVAAIIYGPAAPAIAAPSAPTAPATSSTPPTYSNAVYRVLGDDLTVANTGNQSTFACQTPSSGTIALTVRTAGPASAKGANVGITIRSSLCPGSAQLSLKSTGRALASARSASGQITKRLRIKRGFLYLRLVRAGSAVQAAYCTDGNEFTSIASVELNS